MNRKGNTYGKSSNLMRTLSESFYLANVEVVNPPLTWKQWESIQQRLAQNKLLAQRNAKRDYLLRGLIHCQTHRRRYHGRPRNKSWCYVCRGNNSRGLDRCAKPSLNGPDVERQVKAICHEILSKPKVIEDEITKQSGQVQATAKAISKKLAELDTREAKARTTESKIILEKVTGDASLEAYDMALATVRAQKTWITEERERLQKELETVQRKEQAVITLGEEREYLCSLMELGTNEAWRKVFNRLSVQVQVSSDGTVEACVAIPTAKLSIVSKEPRFP